jgi:hypothetical protein
MAKVVEMMAQKQVSIFEKKMHWNSTPAHKVIRFIKKDAHELNRMNARHKTVDIFFETLQLANRLKINLDKELSKHMKDAKKKYGAV